MTSAGDEIGFPILVNVPGMNVGSAKLFLGDDVFLPRFDWVFGGFPPSEVVSCRRRASLRPGRSVWTPVSVDITEAEVMAEPGRIFGRECISIPTLSRARGLRHI